MITYALADFHVVEEAGSLLLVGLLGLLVLRSGEGTGGLVTDEVAVAGVLRQKSLLLLPRKLIVWHFRLVLKLELVVLGLAAVGLHDVVDVVDLRVVHLVVGLCLLDALADLQGSSAVAADTADIRPAGRLGLHPIELLLVLWHGRSVDVDGLSGLVVEVQELLLQLLEGVAGVHRPFLAERDCISTTELVQDFGCGLRSRLTKEVESGASVRVVIVAKVFK